MNAYKELNAERIDWPSILALRINYGSRQIKYMRGKDDLDHLKQQLREINYDNGYGGQYLFGLILCDDGTWWERGEYDGSEWWEHMMRPSIQDVMDFDDC